MTGMRTVLDETSGQMVRVPAYADCPSGQLAELDLSGGYPTYRCQTCNAILGSVGMRDECYQITQEAKLMQTLATPPEDITHR